MSYVNNLFCFYLEFLFNDQALRNFIDVCISYAFMIMHTVVIDLLYNLVLFNREVMVLKSPIIRFLPRRHFLWGLRQPGLQTRWSKMLTLGLINRVHFRQLKHHHHHSARMGDVLGESLGKRQLQLGSKVLTVETAAFLLWHRKHIYIYIYISM